MCDSSVLRPALWKDDSLSKFSHVGMVFWDQGAKREVRDQGKEAAKHESAAESGNYFSYRFQLEQDVQRLQQQLQDEMELHAFLENVIDKDALDMSRPSCLPQCAQELLSSIAVLEATVSKLEQEMVALHFQLSQERNERRLAEYRLSNSSSPSTSNSIKALKHPNSDLRLSDEDIGCQEPKSQASESTCGSSSAEFIGENAADAASLHRQKISKKSSPGSSQSISSRKPPRGMPSKCLWDHPNELSEEMVRCMKNIFTSLADSALPSKSSSQEDRLSSMSPRGHLSNALWGSSSERSIISSWVQSPQIDIQNNPNILAVENVFDPYRVRGKLSWAEIGNYELATEVSWMSVSKNQLEYASGALRRFRMLVEQLAKVNPIHLSCDEKLAFWINLYNALIMHAYLAYGVPRSDLKLFSLMQKAAYTVGGHSYSAAAIEYAILKMKPPHHRPQIALLLAIHKLKVSEEQRKAAIDAHEPLVAFALSSGMYSSPAVRIFTAKSVRDELVEAQRDFIQASVGLSSKGKLLVPKMIHCFAKSFIDDSNLAVWISRYLPPHQAAFVEQCISQRRQSLLASRNCGILPFDTRFRYLFLPERISCNPV